MASKSYEYSYTGAWVLLRDINVLPQPRKTFEQIEELAILIKKQGILNPPAVAKFDEAGAQRYLDTINMLWRTSFSLGDITLADDGMFCVLLAGERRTRACRHLWSNRPRKKIEVRLCENIPPFEALFLQLSENTHMRVPPHEEAYAYAQLFGLLRTQDPRYPMVRFARNVGRGVETIKRALQFSDLPLHIQDAVESEMISYGIAVQIARLQTAGEPIDQLDWWLMRAVTEGHSVYDFQKLVTEYLRYKNSGQFSLLDIMEQEQKDLLAKPHFRSVVEKNSIQAIHSFIGYMQRVLILFEEEKLGKEDSPFSQRSPLRAWNQFTALQQRVLPHLLGLVSENERQETQILLAQIRAVARVLQQ